MLGSRKPLNRSHILGTLDAAPSGIDCSAQASCSHLCNPPRARSGLEPAGARDCTNACSHPPRPMAPSLMDAARARDMVLYCVRVHTPSHP
jgi:hypothetical protein